jgi:hypothetical protein
MKRVIKNYATLSPELRQIVTATFPEGITSKDVISFKDVKGNRLHGVEIITDDTLYLIRVEGIVERVPAEEGDDWEENRDSEEDENWNGESGGGEDSNNESFDEDRHYYD